MRRSRIIERVALTLLFVAAFAGEARAHRFAPAVVELSAVSGQRSAISGRRVAVGGQRVVMRFSVGVGAPAGLRARLGRRCRALGPERCWRGETARVCERSFDCGARGLSGLGVHVDGRREARTDVVVRVRRAGAERPLTLLLRADQAGPLRLPSGKLPSGERRGASVAGFVVLGVKHILGGIDHVLLVLALLCWTLVRHPSSARARARELFATVSAFTVGHSITLLLGSVAWLDVAPRPAEATIALSLVIIAAEVLRDRGTAAAAARTRRPWLLAVAFGLLHGLGFAGALRELALPHDALPSALLGFNLGVELGQLAVIAAALALWLALARARAARALAPRLAAYATGITGSVLLFARLLAP